MNGGGLDTVVVTGLSGAGRSTAAKCFEDLGYFVVDNLPPELIGTLVDLGSRSQGAVTRLAVVMDVRSRAFSTDLVGVIRDLDERGMRPRVLFLEASDDVLVRRFENVRRAHPLQGDGRLVDGIAAERELLAALRDEADLVLDTTHRSVHELRRAIESAFAEGGALGRLPGCARPWCRSGTSTGCRSTPTWSSTCASCPIRTGSPSCASSPAATRRSATTC